MAVFAQLDVAPTLHGGSGRTDHGDGALQLSPKNGYITPVVARGLGLLVGPFVFFVDDDGSELLDGDEDRRPGSDDDLHFPVAGPPPCGPPLTR
jgi:hypothetical protein